MNKTDKPKAKINSLDFVSDKLQRVLDELETITAEIQEMKDREGGEH